MDDSVTVTGSLTVEDLRRYQYFHMLRRLRFVIPLLLLAGAIDLAKAVIGTLDDDRRGLSISSMPFSILITLSTTVIVLVLPRWKAKRQIENQPYLRDRIEFTFTAEGMATKSRSTSGQMAWSTIREVRETKNLFLLYYAPALAMALPKRFFTDAEALGRWRGLVSEWIAPKKISGTGVAGRWS